MSDNQETTTENDAVDYLSMSDEDIRNLSAPKETASSVVVPEPSPTADTEIVVDKESTDNLEISTPAVDKPTETEKEPVLTDNTTTNTQETFPKEAEKVATSEITTETDKEPSKIDYEAAYKKLTAPFKANNQIHQIDNVEDAISLMQKGIDYTKKLTKLKPALKVVKVLEEANLLDTKEISHLIDIKTGNIAAINRLLKDKNIDPIDLSADKAEEYKNPNYTIDDKILELDSVKEEIKDTPTYLKTLDIITKTWDSESKEAVYNKPEILKIINEHIATGVYEQVQSIVDREKILGRLHGMSNIKAYYYVGEQLQKAGAFNPTTKNISSAVEKSPPTRVIVQPPDKPDTREADAIKEKKKAASLVKAAPATSIPSNILDMPDEEFKKFAKTHTIS